MTVTKAVFTLCVLASSYVLTACSNQSLAEKSDKADNENKQVVLNWHEPKKYRDVRSPNGGQQSYQDNIFFQLDKHFQKSAKKFLPEGYTLKLKVTDVNLAGDTRFHMIGNQYVRLVKPMYWPSMKFEYQLFEGDKLVKSDTAAIKDISFMERSGIGSKTKSLYYEKRLITDWFKDEIKVAVVQWQRHKTAVMS